MGPLTVFPIIGIPNTIIHDKWDFLTLSFDLMLEKRIHAIKKVAALIAIKTHLHDPNFLWMHNVIREERDKFVSVSNS